MFHRLSLDVVLASVGGLAYAFKSLQAGVSLPVCLIMALSVWIIYLADHFWDSFKIKDESIDIYGFFRRNRQWVGILLVLLIIADVFFIFNALTGLEVAVGLGLGSFTFLSLFLQLYLKGNARKFYPKEIIISVLYVTGIWYLPYLRCKSISWEIVHYLLPYLFVVLINVLLFSLFERDKDWKNGLITFLNGLPEAWFKSLIYSLCVLTCFLGLLFLAYHHPAEGIVFIILPFVYFLLALNSSSKLVRTCYGEFTDGALLVFLLFLI